MRVTMQVETSHHLCQLWGQLARDTGYNDSNCCLQFVGLSGKSTTQCHLCGKAFGSSSGQVGELGGTESQGMTMAGKTLLDRQVKGDLRFGTCLHLPTG